MSSLADGMLKPWVMSQQPEGSNYKVYDDASTLKSKHGLVQDYSVMCCIEMNDKEM